MVAILMSLSVLGALAVYLFVAGRDRELKTAEALKSASREAPERTGSADVPRVGELAPHVPHACHAACSSASMSDHDLYTNSSVSSDNVIRRDPAHPIGHCFRLPDCRGRRVIGLVALAVMLGAIVGLWVQMAPASFGSRVLAGIWFVLSLVALFRVVLGMCMPQAEGFEWKLIQYESSARRVFGGGHRDTQVEYWSWYRNRDDADRTEALAPWVVCFIGFLFVMIAEVPELSAARDTLAHAFLYLSLVFFALPLPLASWPGLIGLEPKRLGDLVATVLLAGTVFLLASVVAWPAPDPVLSAEAVSDSARIPMSAVVDAAARASLDHGFLASLCWALVGALAVGGIALHPQLPPAYEDRKNAQLAFMLAFAAVLLTALYMTAG